MENNCVKAKSPQNIIPTGSKQLPRTPPRSSNGTASNRHSLGTLVATPKSKGKDVISSEEHIKETPLQSSSYPIEADQQTVPPINAETKVQHGILEYDENDTYSLITTNQGKVNPESDEIAEANLPIEHSKQNSGVTTIEHHKNICELQDVPISIPTMSFKDSISSSPCNDRNQSTLGAARMYFNMIPSGNQLPRTPHGNKGNEFDDTCLEVGTSKINFSKQNCNISNQEKLMVREKNKTSSHEIRYDENGHFTVASGNNTEITEIPEKSREYTYLKSVEEWKSINDKYQEFPSVQVVKLYNKVMDQFDKVVSKKLSTSIENEKETCVTKRQLSASESTVKEPKQKKEYFEDSIRSKENVQAQKTFNEDVTKKLRPKRKVNMKDESKGKDADKQSKNETNGKEATFTIHKTSCESPNKSGAIESSSKQAVVFTTTKNKIANRRDTTKTGIVENDYTSLKEISLNEEQAVAFKRCSRQKTKITSKTQNLRQNKSETIFSMKEALTSTVGITTIVQENLDEIAVAPKLSRKPTNISTCQERTVKIKEVNKRNGTVKLNKSLSQENTSDSRHKTRQKEINDTIDTVIQKVSGAPGGIKDTVTINKVTKQKRERPKRTIAVKSNLPSSNNKKSNSKSKSVSSDSTSTNLDTTSGKATHDTEKPNKGKRFRLKGSKQISSCNVVPASVIEEKKNKQSPEVVTNIKETRKKKQNVTTRKYESIRTEQLCGDGIEACSGNISTLEETVHVKDTAVEENSLRRSKRVRNNHSVLNQITFYGENEENESIDITRPKQKTTKGKTRKNPLAPLNTEVMKSVVDTNTSKNHPIKQIIDDVYNTPPIKIDKPKSKSRRAGTKQKNSIEVMPSITEQVPAAIFNPEVDEIYETPVKKRKGRKGARLLV